MKFRDTSKIILLYTRTYGRLSVVAKGARARNSKFGASLEPMSRVNAVIYRKEKRDLHLLSQCDLTDGFRRICDDIDRMAAGLGIVELVAGVTHDEEPGQELFMLLTSTLAAIDSATKGGANALYYFEVRLARLLGFQTDFRHCAVCGNDPCGEVGEKEGATFQADRGGCLCPLCSRRYPGGRRVSTRALRVLQRLETLENPGGALTMVVPDDVAREVGDLLRLYLRNHVDGLRDSRAERVFSALR
jgi:DNA repair protein RecO (recombination protein O)